MRTDLQPFYHSSYFNDEVRILGFRKQATPEAAQQGTIEPYQVTRTEVSLICGR
ncbi:MULTISPECIES: hypothetical protein [Microcystis]|uniref:Uncharacterized protein n=1 Tax=Microcystis aeruginosa NIES-44 TaxID=449439 RepID=A0A0A1VP61_MICAE|nr:MULTISPECIES: hypothetical protein [Microcystis]MBD2119005.1 hypothetical protein [Microcystis wesenbergii FACHB-1339]MCZ8039011.1 hypothetical protein [Microcystis sp. LE17-20A]MCZ8213808.1 hypothetical protein [Microcystis sp. LE19-8.1F]GAL91552.1 hypothetical protein N44_01560 [Microcystis aeruginosa NIES-44]